MQLVKRSTKDAILASDETHFMWFPIADERVREGLLMSLMAPWPISSHLSHEASLLAYYCSLFLFLNQCLIGDLRAVVEVVRSLVEG